MAKRNLPLTGGVAGKTILIVDDEPLIQKALANALERAGYSVATALDGIECLSKVHAKRPDLILLDVQMPRMDGFKTCEEIRKIDDTVPIVFHSVRESPEDITAALGRLGDSYILKREPDAVKVAKLEAVLRRAEISGRNAAARAARSKIIEFGRVKVDVRNCRADIGGKTVDLTKTETGILECLEINRGRICSNDDIYLFLYGDGVKGDARSLRSHFCHLREKLGPAAKHVVNIRGVGYQLLRRG
ncbi:MAG: response regulator transcription factor [Kiritimatiellae bacterium]|nr:response regulator transcription factor [Kiritimatiellia bacterium]